MATVAQEKRRGVLAEIIHGYASVRDKIVPERLYPWANIAALGLAGLVLLGLVALLGYILIALLTPRWDAILSAGDSVFTFVFNANRYNIDNAIDCRTDSACSTIQAIVFSLIFFFVLLTGFAYTTLLERRFISFFQQRIGPNRVGPKGLLQPAADGVKLIFKEDIEPVGADKWVYRLAPIIKMVPAIILLAVIPLGPDLIIPWFNGNVYAVPMGLADPNVGVLWLLAITSIGTYGVVLAGWSSNNKYASLGGMRATAQMLSYELSLGVTMAVPVLIVGSMSIGAIVASQTYIYQWFVFQNPLAAGILFIALLAEISRSPFDLPEAEQELTQGYMTEYSGMKFAGFMMAEYIGMIGVSAVVASLYFGGYQDGFGIVEQLPILGPVVLIGKIVLMLIFMVWIRATLPRIRYDRLMTFGWKVLLPLALVAVFWTAIAVLIGDAYDSPVAYGMFAGVVFVVVMGLGYWLLRRNGQTQAQEEDLADDPIVTGERRGVAHAALEGLGGAIALLFGLYNVLLGALDNLAALAPEKPAPPGDETAITPTDGSGD
jgi:NADH-quinone oxidoreductase subunit H